MHWDCYRRHLIKARSRSEASLVRGTSRWGHHRFIRSQRLSTTSAVLRLEATCSVDPLAGGARLPRATRAPAQAWFRRPLVISGPGLPGEAQAAQAVHAQHPKATDPTQVHCWGSGAGRPGPQASLHQPHLRPAWVLRVCHPPRGHLGTAGQLTVEPKHLGAPRHFTGRGLPATQVRCRRQLRRAGPQDSDPQGAAHHLAPRAQLDHLRLGCRRNDSRPT